MTTESIPRTKNAEGKELAQTTTQFLCFPHDVFYEFVYQGTITIGLKQAKLVNVYVIESNDLRASIMAHTK